MSRVCRCGCGASLANLRADAVWASDACRKRVYRPDSPDIARKRRASRDGRRVRVYITPEDSHGDIYRKINKARRRKALAA